MAEQLDQIDEQQSSELNFEKYLGVLRRRHIQLLLPLFFGWLLVWGASWLLPAKYKSSTLILVEEPTMPEKYVASNVNDNLQDRLQSITQQILSRTRLLMIIDKLHLYSEDHLRVTPDDQVEKMRKDISIDLVRDSRNNEISAFRVNFSAHDPKVAQQVTKELTALFISENLQVRQKESQGTTAFIQKQLEDAQIALAAQEEKVRQFEGAHQGSLPNQQASNLQILGGLQGQLQSEQDSLNTAKQQRVYYQSLIEQYKNLHPAVKTSEGGVPLDLTSIDQELSKMRAQLTDLSSRYTDKYPDVQKLKIQIAKTQRLREEILNASKSDAKHSDSTGTSDLESQNTPLLQLKSQLQANDLEISTREKSIAALQGRIAEYQSRLNAEPVTEQLLAELTRGYEQSKANYDDLLKKKNQSEMATDMERMQQGERFTMLDPPSLPTKPDYPNRMKFCGMGIATGLGLGLLVVSLFEFFDDRMHGEKEIKDLLATRILAEIPEIQSPSDEKTQKRRILLGWALAGIVGVVIAAGSAVSFLRG
jgi:polysaccharide chain length determinant protein (PEP-CTERM system associated)